MGWKACVLAPVAERGGRDEAAEDATEWFGVLLRKRVEAPCGCRWQRPKESEHSSSLRACIAQCSVVVWWLSGRVVARLGGESFGGGSASAFKMGRMIDRPFDWCDGACLHGPLASFLLTCQRARGLTGKHAPRETKALTLTLA